MFIMGISNGMERKILIIGGAGFVGINSARYFLKNGWQVSILDNFSRKGTEANINMLKADFPDGFEVVKADIVKDLDALKREMAKAEVVLHLAAQVAVTTSITDPRSDFEANAIGTFNVLEAVRLSANKPMLIYSSTNKVYGSLPERAVAEGEEAYEFADADVREHGISEKEQLDFHSPYGCSKGVADQYAIDYSRIYGLKTVVFRQSCIYGPHQFGVEDQGWVAWFSIAALLGKPLTFYGNGKQVRDLLYIDDLVRLYDLAIQKIEAVSGRAYNIGGGPNNTLSLIQLVKILEKRLGKKIATSTAPVRAGDQPVFVADIRKAERELGWKPKVGVDEGLEQLLVWLEKNLDSIEEVLKL